MGLLTAVTDAVGGVLGDQCKDFYTVPTGLTSTSAMFAAVPRSINTGRGANIRGSAGVISEGSRIVVPEGYGLILMEEGGITGFTAVPGAYEWRSEAMDSHSILAGEGS